MPDPTGPARLGASPIVNVHVVYDRPVTDLPFVAGVATPVQWVFDRTRSSGLDHGQYLAISLSGADREIAERSEDLRARFLPALQSLFPRAREARVEAFFVTREHSATFRQVPGTRALRPGPRTAVPGFYLAGAWTDTGWPATMEEAVRSGLAAAREALVGGGPNPSAPRGGGGMTSTATLPESLLRARAVVQPALRRCIEGLAPELRQVIAYHLGFADRDGRPASGDGEGGAPGPGLPVRPGRGSRSRRGVTGAVAVELVHNFSLLHDDVMDRDLERRHRPTAWALFGVGQAIVTGDALLVLAHELLLEQPSRERSGHRSPDPGDRSDDQRPGRGSRVRVATRRLRGGMPADVGPQDRRVAWIRLVRRRAPGRSGGPVVDVLEEFGVHLGLAFQAVDDLLGIWGRPETTGKPVAGDLRLTRRPFP